MVVKAELLTGSEVFSSVLGLGVVVSTVDPAVEGERKVVLENVVLENVVVVSVDDVIEPKTEI